MKWKMKISRLNCGELSIMWRSGVNEMWVKSSGFFDCFTSE